MITKVKAFKSSDNSLFLSESDAIDHEIQIKLRNKIDKFVFTNIKTGGDKISTANYIINFILAYPTDLYEILKEEIES